MAPKNTGTVNLDWQNIVLSDEEWHETTRKFFYKLDCLFCSFENRCIAVALVKRGLFFFSMVLDKKRSPD